jgi:hypothetical protein
MGIVVALWKDWTKENLDSLKIEHKIKAKTKTFKGPSKQLKKH